MKLLYRSLGDHRILLSILLTILVFFLCYGIVTIEFAYKYAIALINLAFLAFLFFYHSNRPDLKMLSAIGGRTNQRKILAIEYLLLSAPFIIAMCLRGYYLSLGLLFIPFILPFLKQKAGRIGIKFSPFGKGNFEWNSGCRMYGFIQLVISIFFITSCLTRLNFNVSIFLMAATLFVFSLNYSIHESSQFLIKYKSAQEMLHSKMKFSLTYTSLLGVALSLIISIFYLQFSWLYLMIIVQFNIILITQMLTKYAYYPNKLASEANQTILLFVGLIPFLAPVLIILNIHFHKKAKARIQNFYSP